MSFQFNSKTICLTYSNVSKQANQGDRPEEYLLLPDAASITKFLRDKHQRESVLYICTSTERHKDGERHYHVAIKLKQPLRTRDSRFWDYLGIHPNVQSARSFNAWVKYVKKDGDFIEEGFLEESKPTPSDLINMAKTMDKLEFTAYMSINKYQYATVIWEMAHPDQTHTITAEMVINTLDRVDPILIKVFVQNRWDEQKVLILWGDTGLGKTSMAKILVPKPALMVSHLDDLKKFRSGYHKGIIFDDVSIKHLPETAQIHLLDSFDTRSIHVRYGTVTIPKGTPKIFTCNEFPVSKIPPIERRIQHFRITKFI